MIDFKKQLIVTIILLVVTILFFEYSNVDVWVENLFYNSATHTWIIDRDNKILKVIFYTGIKKLLIAIAVMMLFALMVFRNSKIIKEYKKGLAIVVLSAIFVPVVVGGLKAVTNTPCPKNTDIYGGSYPEVKVLDSYPKNFHQKGKIKCWPAGHASGGFALLSLFFLFKSGKNKKRAIVLAMLVGWSMGLYKMMIGDHYLSHTIVTMLLAWLIVIIIAKTLKSNDFT